MIPAILTGLTCCSPSASLECGSSPPPSRRPTKWSLAMTFSAWDTVIQAGTLPRFPRPVAGAPGIAALPSGNSARRLHHAPAVGKTEAARESGDPRRTFPRPTR